MFYKGKSKTFKGSDELFYKFQQHMIELQFIDVLFICATTYYFNIFFH